MLLTHFKKSHGFGEKNKMKKKRIYSFSLI